MCVRTYLRSMSECPLTKHLPLQLLHINIYISLPLDYLSCKGYQNSPIGIQNAPENLTNPPGYQYISFSHWHSNTKGLSMDYFCEKSKAVELNLTICWIRMVSELNEQAGRAMVKVIVRWNTRHILVFILILVKKGH